MNKFKIDLHSYSSSFPFCLFVRQVGWFREIWREVDRFATIDEAKALHEKIKDLPQYL